MDPTLLLIIAVVAVGVFVVTVVLPKLKKGDTPAQAISATETQAVGALHSVATQSLDNAKALGEALAQHLANSKPAADPPAPALATIANSAPAAAPAPIVAIPAAPAPVTVEPTVVAVTAPQFNAPVGMSDRALYDLFIYGGAEGRAFGLSVVHARFGVQDIGYTQPAAAWINKMEQAFPGGPMFNMVALMKRYNIGGTPSQPGALEPSGLAVYLQKRVQTTGLSMDSLLATFGLNASDSD